MGVVLSVAPRLLILLFVSFLFSLEISGQDCTKISADNRQAVVSLTVERENKETGAPETSYGTGFIVTSNGYVLTAYHVVAANLDKFKVSISGAIGSLHGTKYPLDLVDKTASRDIALLKFRDDSKTYSTVPLGSPWNMKVGQELCSLSFSTPLNLDYHPSSGTLSQLNGPQNSWTTQMPSNSGESGGPVFDVATRRVVAMKFGTIDRSSVSVVPENVNFLTPINLARNLIEDYTGLRLPTGDPQQNRPPSLQCVENLNDPRNIVELRLDVDCNGCNHRTETKRSWESSPFRTRTEWNTTQEGWLSASANANVELKCERSEGDYVLGVTANHSSMAGWGGVSGDYRFSQSSIVGSASTGFSVEEGGFCLVIKQYDQDGVRQKGYPGSKYFPEGPVKQTLISIESPSGRSLNLMPGISIPLDDKGFWRFKIKIDSSHRSGWAEDSGQITLKNLLRFNFSPMAQGGSCASR